MSTRLIYHTCESANGGFSPFDEAICSIVLNNDISIACPYLGLDYLKRLDSLSRSWRIVTDVEEWLTAFSPESRQKIQIFIAENFSSIKHCKNLHAKVIVTENQALLGSANFTKKGITGRTEVSVLFDSEPQVQELQEWFESLWLESSSIELEKIHAYVDSLLHQSKTEACSSLLQLPSNSLQINASLRKLTTQNKKEKHQEATTLYLDDSSHERLIQVIKQAPNREWMNQYFDLLYELIDFTGLEDGDPRFVSSIPKDGGLPITINRRYVLCAFRRAKPLVGFIFGADQKQISEMTSFSVSGWQFDAFSGEMVGQTPHFLRFEGFPGSILNSEQKMAWKEAVLLEVDRCKMSSFHRFHCSVVYQAAVDMNYRKMILKEAFQ